MIVLTVYINNEPYEIHRFDDFKELTQYTSSYCERLVDCTVRFRVEDHYGNLLSEETYEL